MSTTATPDRFTSLPDEHALAAVTLWIAATHALPAFECAPRLVATSPDKRCGKSRLLDVISGTCHRPLATADATVADVVPEGYNARTMVHEYGGGSYWVSGSTLFFTNFEDQRLYRVDPGDAPRAITPEPLIPRGDRYADGVVKLSDTDLASGGFGSLWGRTRTWTNGVGYPGLSSTGNGNGIANNGYGMVVAEEPHLAQFTVGTQNSIAVVLSGTTALFFDQVGTSWQPRAFCSSVRLGPPTLHAHSISKTTSSRC